MRLKQWGVVLIGATTLLLTACTVVDLDENGRPIMPADPNAKPSFDNLTPEQIAQQTWQTHVIDPAHKNALDASALEEQLKSSSGTANSVFVQLNTPIDAVDVSNARDKNLTVTINGKPVIIHLGPVIRGNAIRDAAGFKFDDFTNQVQFARLSKAYNRYTVKQLPKVDDSWTGKPTSVLFAVTLSGGELKDAAALELKQEAQ